ncbi:hypothetical protein BGZ88_011563 [Linnemannia elongata]|nr:hypothetical protein BGZ88_011563 [Linnemannia elongata]
MRIIRNPTPPPSPQLDPSDTMFSKLVRSCPHLRVLSIPHYTAKIESFEQDEEWACQDLETLCVKVQGLDDVDACLTKIMALRSSTTWRSSGQVEIEGEGIGDRVIKRLIGLRRLKTVWLGTKDVGRGKTEAECTIAASSSTLRKAPEATSLRGDRM